ncbi:MEDS domain-containing protein [Halopenitus persicus]|uniref:MEDS domain-containing protein n=1 Tax=Halopenitus persicus TaxID=1048396 RepID=UPI000BBA71EA|nr:MEDS domain-containing protein [Halopenitus persicus]
MSTPESTDRTSPIGTDALRYESLRAAFDREDLGRHLALFYGTTAEQLRAATAFIEAALANDRRCLYLADANDAATIETALETVGIDVDRRIDAGDLEIATASDVYSPDAFDADRIVELLADRAHEAAASDRHEGLSVAGENTWSFRTGSDFEDVLDLEVSFDECCPDFPVTALCQYDLRRFTNRSIAAAVWTHKRIVYADTICENPFYVPPSERRNHSLRSPEESDDPRMDVRLMLEQTHELARTRQQVSRREQRLSVVDRALRHNIRNELNVVLGYLELLREDAAPDSTIREYADTCIEYTERVVDRSEKARHIQGTLEDETIESVDLLAEIRTAIARVRDRYPDAAFSLEIDGNAVAIDPAADTDDDALVLDEADETDPADDPADALGRVVAHERIDIALIELLVNAVTHQDDSEGPPEVSIDASTTGDGFIELAVSNPGPPIPEDDRRALSEGTETPLEHGGGLGLWLVKWVVDGSYGRVSFPDGGRDGSTVAIRLPRVDR